MEWLQIEYGKDGIARRVDVKYRNANENVNDQPNDLQEMLL